MKWAIVNISLSVYISLSKASVNHQREKMKVKILFKILIWSMFEMVHYFPASFPFSKKKGFKKRSLIQPRALLDFEPVAPFTEYFRFTTGSKRIFLMLRIYISHAWHAGDGFTFNSLIIFYGLFAVYHFLCLSTYLPIYLSIHLYIYHLSIYLSIFLGGFKMIWSLVFTD